MEVFTTEIPGYLVLEPRCFRDERGFFVEVARLSSLQGAGMDVQILQINHSRSRKNVLRGLHFQHPHPQGKLVWVAQGAVFDVVVDIRRGSPTFGRWASALLDDASHRRVWLAPGLAHGFLTLTDSADVLYGCSAYYHPASEAGIRWDDPTIAIQWPETKGDLILSDKDGRLPLLSDLPAEGLPQGGPP